MSQMPSKEDSLTPELAGGTAYDSLLRDFMEERRLLSVLSFMRKERLSIIQREISGMREQLHGTRRQA